MLNTLADPANIYVCTHYIRLAYFVWTRVAPSPPPSPAPPMAVFKLKIPDLHTVTDALNLHLSKCIKTKKPWWSCIGVLLELESWPRSTMGEAKDPVAVGDFNTLGHAWRTSWQRVTAARDGTAGQERCCRNRPPLEPPWGNPPKRPWSANDWLPFCGSAIVNLLSGYLCCHPAGGSGFQLL